MWFQRILASLDRVLAKILCLSENHFNSGPNQEVHFSRYGRRRYVIFRDGKRVETGGVWDITHRYESGQLVARGRSWRINRQEGDCVLFGKLDRGIQTPEEQAHFREMVAMAWE